MPFIAAIWYGTLFIFSYWYRSAEMTGFLPPPRCLFKLFQTFKLSPLLGLSLAGRGGIGCRAKREQNERFQVLLPESQYQNLAVTVLHVSNSLDSGVEGG